MSNPVRRSPVPASACGLAHAAELIGDRWILLILRELFYGVSRFDDLAADLGVSRAVLTERLAQLVTLGLIERTPYREPGQRARHAYALTDASRALAPALLALFEWGCAQAGLERAMRLQDCETGAELRLALIDAHGQVVPWARVTTAIGVARDPASGG